MTSPSPSPSLPLSRRDEAFLARLAAHAGSTLDGKAIWRAQKAYPWLPTGHTAEAIARVWLVPSVKTEARRYHVALDSGECHYYGPSGARHVCPNRTYGKGRCVHYHAAERAEQNMFGRKATEFFAVDVEAA